MAHELVVIGCSAGGLMALETILGALPAAFALPILVIQHRSTESELLCEVLQARTALEVREALDKEPLEGGAVYIAPPDYHVVIDEGCITLSVDDPVRFARPSIDVALLSAADTYADRLVAVILTGANEDGAAGALRTKNRGGLVIVQDPNGAEVSRMPAAALDAVPTAEVLPLEAIAPRLLALGARAVRSGQVKPAAARGRRRPA